MTDYDRLKELAENVEDRDNWFQALDLIAHGIDYGADAEYIAAATPNLILNLLEDLRITRAERDHTKRDCLVYRKENAALLSYGLDRNNTEWATEDGENDD